MIKKRIVKLVSVSLSLIVLLCAFFVPASAASKASLLSSSRYYFQYHYGRTNSNFPYPDGCVIEIYNSDTGYYRLFNFASQNVYSFENDTVDYPFIWYISNGTLNIWSSEPIYRSTGLAYETNWTCMTSTTTTNDLYSASFSSLSGCTVTANFPACKTVNGADGQLYTRYLPPSQSGSYILAPVLDDDYLNSGATVSTTTDLTNIYSSLLTLIEATYDVDEASWDSVTELQLVNSALNNIKSTLSVINSTTSNIDSTLTRYFDIWNKTFNSISSKLGSINTNIYNGFFEVNSYLEQIVGTEDYSSEDYFGTDESGFSDVASDFDFADTGISSVVNTLGDSFNVIKINFEYICNLLGLNEVIVLLLGFSIICFVLGRAVANRMRDS